MAAIRTQVVLERVGGMGEDVITNTWHWESDDPSPLTGDSPTTNLTGLLDRMKTFYGWCAANILSSLVTGNGVIKVYNLADLPDLFPIREEPFVFTKPTASPLPAEVAIALSYNADRVPGVGQGRLRGRVWLGPIRGGLGNPAPNAPDPFIQASTRTGLLTAAKTMATGSVGGAYRMAIFSPTHFTATSNLGAALNDVTRLTVDDAYDTIRSRGARATQRHGVLIAGSAVPALVG